MKAISYVLIIGSFKLDVRKWQFRALEFWNISIFVFILLRKLLAEDFNISEEWSNSVIMKSIVDTPLYEIYLCIYISWLLRSTLNYFSDVGSCARYVFDDLLLFPSFLSFLFSLFLSPSFCSVASSASESASSTSIFNRPHHVIQCPTSMSCGRM